MSDIGFVLETLLFTQVALVEGRSVHKQSTHFLDSLQAPHPLSKAATPDGSGLHGVAGGGP